jgi:two-component system, NarL family, response regulator NreC
MAMTTIVLADDHFIVRIGLKTLLSGEPGCTVVGEAIDGLAAVGMVRELRPEVLVLDLMMPGMNGIQVIEEIKRIAPQTRIIVLSMHADQSYVSEALRKGADGYVVKDSLAHEIVGAIHTVMSGSTYLSDQLKVCELDNSRNTGAARTNGRDKILTNREREILSMVARGLANKEIATLLSISIRTVEAHRSRIMRKLNIHSHAGLIHFAMRQNILYLP